MPTHRRTTLPALAAAVLTLPAGAALAAAGPAAPTPGAEDASRAQAPAPAATTAAAVQARELRAARLRHRTALRRVVRLARTRARLAGERRPGRAYRRKVDGWSTQRLRAHAVRLKRSVRELRRTGGAPDVPIPAALHAIARCESGGNPRAIGGGGAYRGLFQFDRGTWASVGGSGDPAAAPVQEQYRRAAMLYARAGASPWPVCGR